MLSDLTVFRFSPLRILRVLCASAVLCALAFSFSLAQEAQKAQATEDGAQLKLGNRVLLANEKDGFMAVHKVRYSPDGKRFLVIGCGYECNDNIGFLFNADGSGKRKFTERWDFILQDKVEWSADGKKLFYYRTSSSGADPPRNAPAEGWIEVDAANGRKTAAVSRLLKADESYGVFRILSGDSLKVREAAGAKSKAIGQLAPDAKGIRVTGERQKIGKDVWVKIKLDKLTGWVNQSYLYEESKLQR